MKYLLLIYYDEKALERAGKEYESKVERECLQHTAQLQAQGKFLGANRLYPTATATSIRSKDSKRLVTDGPFAETREQLGGYCLIEAKDLDEAIEIASHLPSGQLGTVKVRPVMEFEPQP
ncbi:MAG: YciI family protein [Deltaproteobacteria bacterium]|nr:YciI family protein [Deltaproteobacteria bacterium]